MPEKTLEQLERIANTLDDVRGDVSGLATSQAVQTEQLRNIVEHLARLNGRVGKSEDRLEVLEKDKAKAEGAWLLLTFLRSLPASIIGAAAMWWMSNSGGR